MSLSREMVHLKSLAGVDRQFRSHRYSLGLWFLLCSKSVFLFLSSLEMYGILTTRTALPIYTAAKQYANRENNILHAIS